jgi:transcriptional regulator with XRE-family HTH domain
MVHRRLPRAGRRLRRSRPEVSESPESFAAHLSEKVKDLRAERRWSLDTLSSVSGVSRSMLSQIERNQVNPTLGVIFNIARAFGLQVGDLVGAPEVSSSLNVIRAGDRLYHYRSDANCTIRTLSPLHLEKDVEFYEVRFKPNGRLQSAAHFTGTREFLTVQSGRVRVESGGESDELEPGDSVSYRADVAHCISNIGTGEAIIFLVDIYH